MTSLIPWKKGRTNGTMAHRPDYPPDLFRHDFDYVFDRLFGRWAAPFAGDMFAGWGLTQVETDKDVRFRIDAPGFEPGEFDIQVTGNSLKVTAEYKAVGKDFADERRMERSFPPPHGVDPDRPTTATACSSCGSRRPSTPSGGR